MSEIGADLEVAREQLGSREGWTTRHRVLWPMTNSPLPHKDASITSQSLPTSAALCSCTKPHAPSTQCSTSSRFRRVMRMRLELSINSFLWAGHRYGGAGFTKKIDPGVPSGHLVVTDEGVSEATNHHLVAAIQQALLGHHISPLQVPPDPNLGWMVGGRYQWFSSQWGEGATEHRGKHETGRLPTSVAQARCPE